MNAGRALIAQVRVIVREHVAAEPGALYAVAQHLMVSTTTIERALALPVWDAAFAVACLDTLDLDVTVTVAAAAGNQA